ncbi:MAG: hypothetical protein KGL59_08515 [Acidobacteriota bacterium]|nr:hypothetical protein [Acidobacteriota bacterium]
MNPNFNGIWKADLQRSRLLGPGPKSFAMSITHSDTDLSTKMEITLQDGAEHQIFFKGSINGEEVTNDVLGQQWRSRLQWAGSELLIDSRVSTGTEERHFRDFWSIAEDGRTLIMEHRDDDLKGQITFLEKEP